MFYIIEKTFLKKLEAALQVPLNFDFLDFLQKRFNSSRTLYFSNKKHTKICRRDYFLRLVSMCIIDLNNFSN